MQRDILTNRYVMAALSVPGLKQPHLSRVAQYLLEMDMVKPRTDDHLKQLARQCAFT